MSAWVEPQDRPRTYSLLGFKAAAVFIAERDIDRTGENLRICDLLMQIESELGYGAECQQAGWLQPDVSMAEIRSRMSAADLWEVPRTEWCRTPEGFQDWCRDV